MRMKYFSLVAGILVAICGQAMAYEAGDFVFRAGAANVSPDVSDNVAGGALQLDVEDNTQLGLTGTYFINPSFGVQLLAASPFNHDITSAGATVGSTKHLPPTLTLQWYPNLGHSVHPYIGAGLNYTVFFDEEITGADLSLSDSVGLALEAGIDIDLTDNIVLNAAFWMIDINTDVSVNGTKLGELEIDPYAFMIGLGYKF